jgi:hypothetical protein
MAVLADTGNRSTNTDHTFIGANVKYKHRKDHKTVEMKQCAKTH